MKGIRTGVVIAFIIFACSLICDRFSFMFVATNQVSCEKISSLDLSHGVGFISYL